LDAERKRRFSMFRERIAQHYARLGRNQKRIAQRLEVDPATVTRFAQRLGYAGYPELLREVQELVKEELKAAYG
jgi:DNA-binding MurR/RpiR family transcriptional regulator